MTAERKPPEAPGESQARRGPTVMGVAWTAISVFILVSLGLVFLAYLGTQAALREAQREPVVLPAPLFDPPVGWVESWTLMAAQAGVRAVESELDTTLDVLFAPVHDAVPTYADFHYSVLGEYIELTDAATGAVSRSMQKRLFEGFDERLGPALAHLDRVYAAAFDRELEARVEADRRAFAENAIVGDMTRLAIADASARFKLGVGPEVLAAGAGAVGAKATATALGKALMKNVAKIVGKSAAKPLEVTGAAAAGGVAGSVLGPPGAIVGGIVGAGVGWFAMDFVVMKVDEFISRDDFEADLHALIDAEQAALRAQIETALDRRSGAPPGSTIKDVRDAGASAAP